MPAPVITWIPDRLAVEIYLSSLPDGTATLTLWRLTDREQEVRGAVNAPVAGQFTHIDTEVPFTVQVAYRAECFDADGLLIGYTDTASTSITMHGVWVHNPLDPSNVVEVGLSDEAFRTIRAANTGDFYPLRGHRQAVFLAGAQTGVTEVNATIYTYTKADRSKLLTMLGRGDKPLPPVLCFRFGAGYDLPISAPFYAAIPDYAVQNISVDPVIETTRWVGDATETLPPAPGITVAVLTYKHVNAKYRTLAQVARDNLTYGAVNRRYDLAE